MLSQQDKIIQSIQHHQVHVHTQCEIEAELGHKLQNKYRDLAHQCEELSTNNVSAMVIDNVKDLSSQATRALQSSEPSEVTPPAFLFQTGKLR